METLIIDAMSASGNHYRIHKALCKTMNPNCAVFLALMLDKSSYWKREAERKGEKWDGWFFKVQEEIEEEICLTPHEQRSVRKWLVDQGFIEERIEMIMAGGKRIKLKINFEALARLLQDGVVNFRKLKNFTSGNEESLLPEVKNLHNTSPCIRPLLTVPTGEKNISKEKKEVEVVTKEEKPSTRDILRVWKSSLPEKPSFDSRREMIEELFTTLKSYGYKEDDLPSGFSNDVLKPWLLKKGSKNYEWVSSKNLEDYEMALSILAPDVKLKEATPEARKPRRASKEKNMGTLDVEVALEMMMEDDEMEKLLAEYNKLTNPEDVGGSNE
jgi:hypothetical protein